MSFRQWRVAAVVVMLSTIILVRGGGGFCTFQKQIFFFRNFDQIFFIHQWPLSLTMKGGIKISPHIQGDGGGCQIQQNFFQDSKRRCKGYFVVDQLILRGGGADKKKCRGRLFISSMGQEQDRFQNSLYEKLRVALLTSDQKVADSIPAVRRTMCECSIDSACKTPLAAQWRGYQV